MKNGQRMTRIRRLRLARRADSGIALITVLMVLAVLTALGTTAGVVGLKNLENANRDRQANTALGASEAGIAQAMEYIRSAGVAGLNCPEDTWSACPASPAGWNSPLAPTQVHLDGTAGPCAGSENCYAVWIGVVQPYDPGHKVRTGIYRIHSTGLYGRGPAARRIAVDVTIKPSSYPIGVYGDVFSFNGTPSIRYESLFTLGCVQNRAVDDSGGSGLKFAVDVAGKNVIDPYYDLPVTAHSANQIYTNNNNCTEPIHAASKCDASHPNDQDSAGGAVGGTSCAHQYLHTESCNGDPPRTYWYPYSGNPCDSSYVPDSSAFSINDLALYGYRPNGLSEAQYNALRSRAQALGTYNIGTGSIMAALTAAQAKGVTHPVLFWDNGLTSSLKDNMFPSYYNRAPNHAVGQTCTTSPAVTIVVLHDNLDFQGGNNTWFDASIFVPNGTFDGQGGYKILGTLFAQNVSMSGTTQFELDECFVKDQQGPLLDLKTSRFSEDDATDVS